MYLWGKVYVVRSDEKPTLEIKMPTGEGQGVGNLSPMNEVESRKNKVTGINIRKTLRNIRSTNMYKVCKNVFINFKIIYS